MSKSAAKKASSSLNYQDDINSNLNREHDIDATAEDEENDDKDDEENSIEAASRVKEAVLKVIFRLMARFINFLLSVLFKLQKIIRSVHSTPQRRESWARQIQTTNAQNGTSQPNLMLILNVKTRWSSTHQMLRKTSF